MLEMLDERLERVAGEVLCGAGLGGAVDAYDLCAAAGVRVVPGAASAFVGSRIYVNQDDPPERQRFAIARELSRVILRERGIEQTEHAAGYLASALLHPRAEFRARLRSCAWDLAALRVDYPFSSYEALGRRAVNLQRAVLWVCDRGPRGRKSRRTCSRGTPASVDAAPTRIEREIVRAAATSLTPCRAVGIGAWPLATGNHLRVLSLARASALVASPRLACPSRSPA